MPQSTDSKILANIVKHMAHQDADPLTPLIDEYLIKRELPKYRKRRIQTVEIPLVPRLRPGGRLSPSTLCGCERQAALKFLGIEGKKRVNPDTELIFEDGNWRHHKWQAFFKDMEQVLGEDRFRCIDIEEPIRINKLHIAGHLDVRIAIFLKGRWEEFVIDIKGANNYAFEAIYRARKPEEKHVFQLLPYMRAKGVKNGMLLYDSKNNNQIHIFMVRFTDEQWKIVREWCKRVIKQVEYRRLPPMHSECDHGNFLYDKCPFRGLCWGNKTDQQIQKEAYRDFPGVEALWEAGHAEAEADDIG